MLQDIAPRLFSNEYAVRHRLAPDNDSVVIIMKDDLFLCRITDNRLELPKAEGIPSDCLTFLTAIDETRFYYYNCGKTIDYSRFFDEGYVWKALREWRYVQPAWLRYGALVSAQLAAWYRQNRFCGSCGALTEIGTEERSLICPCCHAVIYPRINPCVIVGVINGDKILLTQYAGNRPNVRYALVAGYIETGETAEQTVAREVKEETGLNVKNIRYYKSQPWPFSSSLLFGYFAEVDGDTEPHPDGCELAVAQWFSRDEVPIYENEISMTHEMMDVFRRGLIK